MILFPDQDYSSGSNLSIQIDMTHEDPGKYLVVGSWFEFRSVFWIKAFAFWSGFCVYRVQILKISILIMKLQKSPMNGRSKGKKKNSLTRHHSLKGCSFIVRYTMALPLCLSKEILCFFQCYIPLCQIIQDTNWSEFIFHNDLSLVVCILLKN